MVSGITDPSFTASSDQPPLINPADLGPSFNVTLSILCGILGITGISLNALVISYKMRAGLKKPANLLYVMLSSSDGTTSLAALLHVVFFITMECAQESEEKLRILYVIGLIAYIGTLFSFRVSMATSVLFAVIRTGIVLFPLRVNTASKTAMKVAILITVVVFVIPVIAEIACIPDYPGMKSVASIHDFLLEAVYDPLGNFFIFKKIEGEHSDGEEAEFTNASCHTRWGLTGSFILLACLLISLCTVTQVYVLVFKPGTVNQAANEEKRTTAITFVTISILFVVCNTISLHPAVLYSCDSTKIGSKPLKDHYLVGPLTMFINAALNPLIVLARSELGTRARTWRRRRRRTLDPVTVTSTVFGNPANHVVAPPAPNICCNQNMRSTEM